MTYKRLGFGQGQVGDLEQHMQWQLTNQCLQIPTTHTCVCVCVCNRMRKQYKRLQLHITITSGLDIICVWHRRVAKIKLSWQLTIHSDSSKFKDNLTLFKVQRRHAASI